jgi:rhodanese-related sulfurtransferase
MRRLLMCLVAFVSVNILANDLPDISAEQLLAADKQEWLILDVRTADEYAEGHVPGAINIAHSALASRIEEIKSYSDKPVVVYCRSGYRAGLAGDILQEANFSDVRHLDGDITGWQKAGHEMEK